MKRIFVTGGAGYIGSHVVRLLGDRGYDVLTYDNLSTGHRESVLCGDLVVGDLGNAELLENVMSRFRPDAVMHFAAYIQVEESVRDPLKYYRNNVANTLTLLESMKTCNVSRLIFSSTAAVYGIPDTVPIVEYEPLKPVNPYGHAKMFVEGILSHLAVAAELRYVSLRYFNAAGANPGGAIGECHSPETHLIPLVLMAAAGRRKNITIFGTDYDTPDGTCIRDYIHVDDLADAHLLALEHLAGGGGSEVYNLGYGHGYSVRQVVETAKKVTGVNFLVEETGRRAGDPPVLVADSTRLMRELNWHPRHDDLAFIIKTAWDWERSARCSRT